MSAMSEIQRRIPPLRRGWPGSEKVVLWGLTLLIGILSIAPLTRLVWAAIAPDGVPDLTRLTHLLGTRKVVIATMNTLTQPLRHPVDHSGCVSFEFYGAGVTADAGRIRPDRTLAG
jgi:hypothetical protein